MKSPFQRESQICSFFPHSFSGSSSSTPNYTITRCVSNQSHQVSFCLKQQRHAAESETAKKLHEAFPHSCDHPLGPGKILAVCVAQSGRGNVPVARNPNPKPHKTPKSIQPQKQHNTAIKFLLFLGSLPWKSSNALLRFHGCFWPKKPGFGQRFVFMSHSKFLSSGFGLR